jgi:thiol-disulfide isomerase/thioredoxin
MKKLLLAILTLSALAIPVFASFTDVSENHEFYEAIDYMQTQGIVEGYDNGEYRPDQLINRAEFTKIVMGSIMDINTSDTTLGDLTFTDISDGQWYNPYVRTAVESGIISGYPDNTYRPSDNINFAEASKIVALSKNYGPYNDEPWYLPYMNILLYNDAITNDNDKSDSVTRGEMAQMIFKLGENQAVSEYIESDDERFEERYEGLLGLGPMVLFFHADWCPYCVAHEEAIKGTLDEFTELFILEVDYDSSQDLRAEYGVTLQYTFVFIDENGEVTNKVTTTDTDEVLELLAEF